MKLDKDGSGSIDKEEFLQIPQIASNPLASRMIAIFDEEYVHALRIATTPLSECAYSGSGSVDFQEFVAGLSAFSNRGEREEKLKCEQSGMGFVNAADSLHSRIQSVRYGSGRLHLERGAISRT